MNQGDDPIVVREQFGNWNGCSPQELRSKNPQMFQELVRRSRNSRYLS